MTIFMKNIFEFVDEYKDHIMSEYDKSYNHNIKYNFNDDIKEWTENLIKLEKHNQYIIDKSKHIMHMWVLKYELKETVTKWKIIKMLNFLECIFPGMHFKTESEKTCQIYIPGKKIFYMGINTWEEDCTQEPLVVVQAELKTNSLDYLRSLGLVLDENDIIIDNGVRYYFTQKEFVLAILNDFM